MKIKKKICIVVPYFTAYIRSNEYGLAESLTKIGYEVTVITSTEKGREKFISKKKHDFHSLPSYHVKVKYMPTVIDFFDRPIVLGVFLHVLNNDYDVVMLQEDHQPICHFAFYAAKLKGIPVILSSERAFYPKGTKRLFLKIIDKTANKLLRDKVDAYTAHCTATKEFLVKNLEVHEKKVKVIHVGVDTKLFNKIENSFFFEDDDKFRILTVARLVKVKGIDYLIKAMKIAKEKVPNAKLYIIGKGPEERNLKMLVKKLELKDYIEFIQVSIPNYEMPHMYSSCDIYVQPSIIEPFGIAVLEAMACDKPVVSSNVGGMRDTVVDGYTGFLVEPKNSSELARKIVELLKDDGKRENVGKNARRWVVNNFDWNKIGMEYHRLIKYVIEKGNYKPGKLIFDENYCLKMGYDKLSQELMLYYQEQTLKLQRYFTDKMKILDAGCGLGFFLSMCDKAGWSTRGIDISEYAIEEAKKRTKAKLAVCDIQDGIPFEEEFDAITCFEVIEHLENPETALSNMFHKLNKGGFLLLTTPNLRSKIWKRISGWQEDETHISLKKSKEWKRCLRSIGFEIICSKTIFPILSQRRGIKSLFGKFLAAIGLGSTLYLLARREE